MQDYRYPPVLAHCYALARMSQLFAASLPGISRGVSS